MHAMMECRPTCIQHCYCSHAAADTAARELLLTQTRPTMPAFRLVSYCRKCRSSLQKYCSQCNYYQRC